MKLYKRSKFRIMARQIAQEAVRNTHLENLHANCKGFTDKEMRTLMLEVEENLRISLWYWSLKHKDQELLKRTEDALFGEYGVSWDIPARTWNKLKRMMAKST